jgi:uncharacterized lipoprotein YmbA
MVANISGESAASIFRAEVEITRLQGVITQKTKVKVKGKVVPVLN